jgi:hypothetical protein
MMPMNYIQASEFSHSAQVAVMAVLQESQALNKP